MTRWFPVESADADFLASAPHIFRFHKRFSAPPEKVWESLASDASLSAWGPSVKEVKWTSPRPFGVGTTREVALVGGPRVQERFFRWDEGRGYSFEVTKANAPMFRRMAEDYTVEPDGGVGTLFTWTVAIEPKPAFKVPFRVLAPVVKAAFGRLASDGQRYFAKQT
ncbi:SRPBCC family protein [Mycobacterium hubeiense]|uniref:SRPBCC family protein n=1 Tax=Mycobacterium hubeiense TaxID=1867256 RepID=UPI000C7F413C|nr:SRPBCC family protein [Mycobacterium sp. QGD 101]